MATAFLVRDVKALRLNLATKSFFFRTAARAHPPPLRYNPYPTLPLVSTRLFHHGLVFRNSSTQPPIPPSPPSSPQPPPPPKSNENKQQREEPERSNNSAAPQPLVTPVQAFGGPGGLTFPSFTKSPTFDAALTTVIGLVMVFLAGILYLIWYKRRVLDKIELAFKPGYDPALQLANHGGKDSKDQGHDDRKDDPEPEHMRREEQNTVDRIIRGQEGGHYFLIMGPKGSGKTSMIFDAMRAVNADGVAFCDAHEDLEVFRLRFGRALNFEYMEDSQTGLFQRRDPREGGPSLDIERALSKLEKVALRMYEKRDKKPLVLVLNNIHMFGNNDESRRLLLQIQQKAESWSESGIMTVVFSTDDFWPFPILKKNANRMQILSISDLSPRASKRAVRNFYRGIHNRHPHSPSEELTEGLLSRVISIVGGRLSFLSRIARSHRPMEETAHTMLHTEKNWILSQIGLIPDCDDDVMDEQKWSSCSWLLLREFVKMYRQAEAEREKWIAEGGRPDEKELDLPSIPYWRCRQIMTRTDFLEGLDHTNIISIDFHLNVRPDSMLTLQAAAQVVEQEGFDEILDGVRDRIDEIESLHRTRELTFKDVGPGDKIRVSVDKGGGSRWWWSSSSSSTTSNDND